ncbi:hypothetical protein HDU76_004921 [Blyttiomyces sp. JEL0837]|nr:hypothetical protein HDU76_004921 [Blyttiomyces sp. JEL0837]
MGSTLFLIIAAFASAVTIATPLPLATDSSRNSLRIELDYGAFTGLLTTPANDTALVRSHLGIPFVQPPVGDLRFAVPTDFTTHLGERNATQIAPACFQDIPAQYKDYFYPTGAAEDCLYLNVWSPAGARPGDNLPVMVWVYGGYFTVGGTADPIYNGEYLVYESMRKRKDVVVVTIAYRLSVFGFSASDDLAASGALNLGLLDQKKAFEWVRKYIRKFGGDPEKVTAFGESAGAISIGQHLTSSFASSHQYDFPLFDHAILQSASSLVPRPHWTTISSTVFAETLINTNCQSASNKLACLRTIDPETLLHAGNNATAKTGKAFGPVIDDSYIVEDAIDALDGGRFAKMPVLAGYNKDEGTAFAYFVQSQSDYETFVASSYPNINSENRTAIYNAYPLSSFNNIPFYAGSAIAGDLLFKCPVQLFADSYSTALLYSSQHHHSNNKTIPVYHYHLTHKPGKFLWFGPGTEFLGVSHGAELVYAFNILKELYTDEERQFAKILSDYWIQFAHRGDPNFNSAVAVWPQYVKAAGLVSGGGDRLRFDSSGAGGVFVEKAGDLVERCGVWKDVFRYYN